jgi:hypothetical protein
MQITPVNVEGDEFEQNEDVATGIADKLNFLLNILTCACRFGMPALTAQVEDH